jgi:putative intracellular protease/amidase
MPRPIAYIAYGAAFAALPIAAAILGFRDLTGRQHPERLAPLRTERLAQAPRPEIDPAKQTVVVLLGADITEITDALGPYEMFARTGRYNVVTAAPERQPTLLTGGLRILPHYSLAEVDARLGGKAPAVVMVPNIPNIAEAQNAAVVGFLQRSAAGGSIMHSWCTGAMALAQAGLLDGRTATAHWGDLALLEERYPRVRWVRGVRWVDHGQLVMSAGITSGVDASLRVIGRLAGDSVAQRVAREIRYPDYHFAIDPRAEQYAFGAADLVLLANAAFRPVRPRVGVALYDGVTELDLGHVYDAHAATFAANVETVTRSKGIVTSAHGLTLLPSDATAAGEAGAVRVGKLDRLVVPGTDARERAASLVAAVGTIAPALRAEYPHADDAGRYGLEPIIEDLARTADLATATFALRRLEYRSPSVRLAGGAPWPALLVALFLGATGLALALGIARRRRMRPAAARSGEQRLALASALAIAVLAPSRMEAQSSAPSIDVIAPGTRIRADLYTGDGSRIRRFFGQSSGGKLAGELVAIEGDTVLLSVRAGSGTLRIPRSALRDVYVSRGWPNRAESAVRSAIVPAIAGAAFRGLSASMQRREPGDPSPGRAALTGAATSAAFAGAIGLLFPKERWSRLGR